LRKFSVFGALAQLVEQWPFKPFVTGSNPVRPSLLITALCIITIFIEPAKSSPNQIILQSQHDIELVGELYRIEKNDSVFLIVHGARSYKGMEIIQSLTSRLHSEGYDVLTINLSYGIDKREDKFLDCNIKHNHNEHQSVKEIVKWYKYLENKGYKKINFIGHSRGAYNVVQALSIINKATVNSYLLAPTIDTYIGTKEYYENELNIPYKDIISDNKNYYIKDKYGLINFLFCENVNVSAKTFRSYLDFSNNKDLYPFTFDMIELLNDSKSQTIVFSGTEDEILEDTYKKYDLINNANIRTVIVDGAGHFFRDLYLDEVIDVILE
jgi:alpha/beta superfamily hydrolase